MATRKRHTPQQVVRKLTQADRMLAEGKEIADVCRELRVSEQTYYRWRNQFGGLKADAPTLVSRDRSRPNPMSGDAPAGSQ
jgi:putative transposase